MIGYIRYIKGRYIARWNAEIKRSVKYVENDANLQSLHHAMHTALSLAKPHKLNADRKYILNKSIYYILKRYGQPQFITNVKYGKVSHETVHYKKRLYGYKTSIVYHFVNKRLVAVFYKIRYSNSVVAIADLQQLVLQQFGIDIHQIETASFIDTKGNVIECNTQHDLRIDIYFKPSYMKGYIRSIIRKSVYNKMQESVPVGPDMTY